MDVLILAVLRAESQVMHEEADQSANHCDVAKPLQRPLPEFYGPRNMRVLRQATVKFRLGSVMQHVNHAGATHARWVVHDLMHAGSSPSLTRSVHSVHLNTRLVLGFIFGMSNGHPVMQYPQPMQSACWKSTMPFVYCTIAPSAGHAARHPGSAQCMHWFLRISHISVPSSRSCSLKRIRFQ